MEYCNTNMTSQQIPELLQQHFSQLHDGSGIAVDVMEERSYRGVVDKKELEQLGFSRTQRRTPGILIPVWGVDGQRVGYVYRPDHPRVNPEGKTVKYENPKDSSLRLDWPLRCRDLLSDPSVPLWITEGVKKGDALAGHGICVVVLFGVWAFKGKNIMGGTTFLADWDFLNHNCGDVFQLQQILGHSIPQMARRYMHYTSAQALMNSKTASRLVGTGKVALKPMAL